MNCNASTKQGKLYEKDEISRNRKKSTSPGFINLRTFNFGMGCVVNRSEKVDDAKNM